MNIKARCKMTESRLARMKKEIMAVPLWNHMSGRELANELGYNEQYVSSAVAELRARGELEAASPITLLKIRRYHKLNKLLENPRGDHHIDSLVIQIYGQDGRYRATSRRCQLRELIADCKHAGFPVPHEDRIFSETPCSGKISQKKMTLSYIPLSKVDPDHLAAFVSLCQMNGGRHAA